MDKLIIAFTICTCSVLSLACLERERKIEQGTILSMDTRRYVTYDPYGMPQKSVDKIYKIQMPSGLIVEYDDPWKHLLNDLPIGAEVQVCFEKRRSGKWDFCWTYFGYTRPKKVT